MKVAVLVLIISCGCFSYKIITAFDDDEESINEIDNNFIDGYDSGNSTNPDVYLTTPQIIRRHGYAAESHVVETIDGYLLTLHRISANNKGQVGKQPVFLQHGLLSSSADWVIMGNNSLAFILSDLGYDVWLGNARGNTYSKAHVAFPPDSTQFWDFSFHEMGVYDLPAALSHVANITGMGGNIIFIGHSMGTTMFYVFSSVLSEFAATIVKMAVTLAPVAYTTHMSSPLRYFAPFSKDIERLTSWFGIKEFLPNGYFMKIVSAECKVLHIESCVCEKVIFVICGFDANQLDEELLPLIFAHSPAGSSAKTIIHYAQEVHQNGDFVEYNYGEEKNLIKYGTPNPPLYNLTDIKVPLYFMYSENDFLANPIDVKRLAQQVQKNIGLYDVPLPTFNHVDFLWARDAPELVYNKLIEIIKLFKI